MKNSLIKLATLLFAVALATNSFAAKGGKGGKAAGNVGKVTAIADGTITVSNKKLGEQTYKTDATTKVLKADGTDGALSDLKKGLRVRVVSGGTDMATAIQVVERKKKAEPSATPTATPSATPAPSVSPTKDAS